MICLQTLFCFILVFVFLMGFEEEGSISSRSDAQQSSFQFPHQQKVRKEPCLKQFPTSDLCGLFVSCKDILFFSLEVTEAGKTDLTVSSRQPASRNVSQCPLSVALCCVFC